MHLEQLPSRFSNLSRNRELKYSLARPASDEEVARREQKLGLSFPAQVRLFYRSYNGLRVEEPHLEVLPVERLSLSMPNRLHFATLNGSERLYFDVSRINEAEQWDIVAADGFRVTLTMASFWSTRMWSWIEKKRAIWQPEAAI
jgi:cell wall assembly regulator SMI1